MESKTLLDLACEASDAMLRIGRTLHSVPSGPAADYAADLVHGASAEVMACTALLAGASRGAPENLREGIAELGGLRAAPADGRADGKALRRLVEETAAYVREVPDGAVLRDIAGELRQNRRFQPAP